ncbi:hypothetical protein Vretimale_8698 [Volvox reticuliferus]|uniref:Uncharacterized protein n=1 Tax=Volvox reticuliferus TaxID=1737510 RepID=A0A8J4C720_9CHLO|nr:hypothetical protein Vretifemale_6358 [Volvox reticuliferus]GIM04073.1 hypothetical protein Vretimale_8698 [Volvox reticuliferus]
MLLSASRQLAAEQHSRSSFRVCDNASSAPAAGAPPEHGLPWRSSGHSAAGIAALSMGALAAGQPSAAVVRLWPFRSLQLTQQGQTTWRQQLPQSSWSLAGSAERGRLGWGVLQPRQGCFPGKFVWAIPQREGSPRFGQGS